MTTALSTFPTQSEEKSTRMIQDTSLLLFSPVEGVKASLWRTSRCWQVFLWSDGWSEQRWTLGVWQVSEWDVVQWLAVLCGSRRYAVYVFAVFGCPLIMIDRESGQLGGLKCTGGVQRCPKTPQVTGHHPGVQPTKPRLYNRLCCSHIPLHELVLYVRSVTTACKTSVSTCYCLL